MQEYFCLEKKQAERLPGVIFRHPPIKHNRWRACRMSKMASGSLAVVLFPLLKSMNPSVSIEAKDPKAAGVHRYTIGDERHI
jgi:hypothetical protein